METSAGAQMFSLVGGVLAACLSASVNHSFWWGLLHFICGWFYVIYFVIFKTGTGGAQ